MTMTEAHKITNPENIPPVETERLLVEVRAQLGHGNYGMVFERLGPFDIDSFADQHYRVRANQILGEAHLLRRGGADDAAEHLRKALQQTADLEGATAHLYRASILCSFATLNSFLDRPEDVDTYLSLAKEHLNIALAGENPEPSAAALMRWVKIREDNPAFAGEDTLTLRHSLLSPSFALPSPGDGEISGPYNDPGDHRNIYIHPASYSPDHD